MRFVRCARQARVPVLCVAMVAATATAVSAARRDTAEDWQTRIQLVERFGAEWYKIGVLLQELGHVRNVLTDIRDIEIFPIGVTGIDDACRYGHFNNNVTHWHDC